MKKQWKEIPELKGDVGCTSLATSIAKKLGLLENASVAYIDDIPRWHIDYEYFVQAYMLKKKKDGKLCHDVCGLYKWDPVTRPKP